MSLAPRHWELPGPAAFVQSVAERAGKHGIVAVLHPPHLLPGLEAAMAAELQLPPIPACDPNSEKTPLELVSAALGVVARSAHGLPTDPAAEGRAVIVGRVEPAHWSRWETTLRAFAAGCAHRPPFGAQLIVVAASALELALGKCGIRTVKWQQVVGSRDAMLHALDRLPPTLDPLVGRMIVEVAVALAGWELGAVADLVDEFVSFPERAFSAPAPPRDGLSIARWDEGTSDVLDGVQFDALAICGDDEIRRRLWRGQINVLFGWLESERTEFVRRHSKALRTAAQRPGPAIEEMEWGAVSQIASEAFGPRSRQLEIAILAREVRNALAHLKPVNYSRFSRLRFMLQTDRSKANGH